MAHCRNRLIVPLMRSTWWPHRCLVWLVSGYKMVCFPDGCLSAKMIFEISYHHCFFSSLSAVNLFQAVCLLFTVYTGYSIQQVIGSKRGNSDDGGMSSVKIEIM